MATKRSKFGHVEYVRHGVYRIHWREKGRRRSVTIYGTRRDADLELGRIQLGLENPSTPDTFRQFWKDTVFPSCSDLAQKTINEYERLWKREIEPRIGHWKIGDTTHKMLQDGLISEIDSATVQRATARLLSKICNMAAVDGIIAASPCATRFRYKRHEPREKNILETVDITKFLKDISGIKYETLICLMLGGGLRLEEATAMRRERMSVVELNGKRYVDLYITDTLVSIPKKHLQPYTKTHSSRRHMLIGEPFATPIIKWMGTCESGPLMPSGKQGESAEAEYTSPSTIQHNWKVWCEGNEGRKAGYVKEAKKLRDIPYVRLGDMRTCWSTMQSEAGSADSLIAKAMGHTDGSTRSRHYIKMTKRLLAQLADNLEAAINE